MKNILVYGILGLLGITFAFLAMMLLGPIGFLFILFLVSLILFAFGLRLGHFSLLCIILVLLPFSRVLLQVEIGIITFNPYILGMLFLVLISLHKIFIKGENYGFRATDFFIMLLCFSYLTSTIYAPDVKDSGLFAFHGIFVPVISYFVIKVMTSTEDSYRKATLSLLVGITLFGSVKIVEFLHTYSRTKILMPPVSSATFLVPAILYLIYAKYWKTRSGLLVLIVLLAALITTYTRVYTLLLFLSPLFYWMIKRGDGFKLSLSMLILSLIGTLLLASYGHNYNAHIHSISRVEHTFSRLVDIEFWKISLLQRAMLYKGGIETFLENPIFGIGFYRGLGVIGGVDARHSLHVEWLETGGIVGWLLYSSVFLSHFKAVAKKASTDLFCALNLLAIFFILCNALNNCFITGMNPYVAFVLMGFNEARLNLLSKEAAIVQPVLSSNTMMPQKQPYRNLLAS